MLGRRVQCPWICCLGLCADKQPIAICVQDYVIDALTPVRQYFERPQRFEMAREVVRASKWIDQGWKLNEKGTGRNVDKGLRQDWITLVGLGAPLPPPERKPFACNDTHEEAVAKRLVRSIILTHPPSIRLGRAKLEVRAECGLNIAVAEGTRRYSESGPMYPIAPLSDCA